MLLASSHLWQPKMPPSITKWQEKLAPHHLYEALFYIISCFFVCFYDALVFCDPKTRVFLFVFKFTVALWILQVKLLVPKKMSSMGNRELEIGRYSIHYFDYFSFPLILGLSPSGKEHSLKYTKQYLVLLFIISIDWQAWSLLFTHLIRANSFCLLIWICSIDFPHLF